jgi:hypothetical protein
VGEAVHLDDYPEAKDPVTGKAMRRTRKEAYQGTELWFFVPVGKYLWSVRYGLSQMGGVNVL